MKKVSEMQEYEINGIRNLWEDFQHVVHNKKVDLMTATIGLMSSTEIEHEDVTVIPFNRINVKTMSIIEKDLPVTDKELAKKIIHAGCFYKIDGKYYIPSGDVKRRGIYDYFRTAKEKERKRCGYEYEDLNLKPFADNTALKNFAQRFRNVGSATFIGKCIPGTACVDLLGIRSKDGKVLNADVIINKLDEKYRDRDLQYFSDYRMLSQNDVTMTVYCNVKKLSKNGVPLYVSVTDTSIGRKCIQIDICACINDRMYVIDNIDIVHRIPDVKDNEKEIAKNIVDEVDKLLTKYENVCLGETVSADVIEKVCKPTLPKKAQKRFMEVIKNHQDIEMIETAYDAADELFASEKDFKTQDYDRGKRKYYTAIGSVLTKTY